MTEEDILQRLTNVFQEVFDDRSLVVRPEMTANDVERWDSLSHVDMIISVEEEFAIRIPTLEVMGLKNVGDLIQIVRSRAT